MIAFLGMYDMPVLKKANDLYWQEIRKRLTFGPDNLTREGDVWDIWLSPDLVFAQTCGLPYRARLHGRVQLVGTPDYGLPGCAPGHYFSALVARKQDSDDPAEFTNRTFAYNEPLSQSGWAGPMTYLGRRGVVFSNYLQTGAHVASIKAVTEQRADLAGIDALTWKLLEAEGETGALKVIAKTDPVPGLPYITSAKAPANILFDATQGAIHALPDEVRHALRLNGLVRIDSKNYLKMETPPPPPIS